MVMFIRYVIVGIAAVMTVVPAYAASGTGHPVFGVPQVPIYMALSCIHVMHALVSHEEGHQEHTRCNGAAAILYGWLCYSYLDLFK